MRKLLLACSFGFVLAHPVSAQGVDRPRDYDSRVFGPPPCDWSMEARALTACLSDRLVIERSELDAALQHYLETLGRDEARSLERAQDDWERFVEDDCDASARSFGDVGLEAVALLSCMVEEISRRRFQVSLLLGARTRVDFDRSAPCFVPDSELVEVVGWVGERQYEVVGPLPPPGADSGGQPRGDPLLQQVLVLNLDLPLCLNYGEGPVQVTAVQMVARSRSTSRGLARYIGQHVEVVGRLFLGRTAADHTPILIMVAEVAPFG